MRIRSKRQMYRLYEAGAFGNKLQTWERVEDVDHQGTVSLRYAGKAGGGFAAYDVPVADIPGVVEGWVDRGAERALIRVNESAPDERLVIQGEVAEQPWGLVLRWSDYKGKMRDAMRWALHSWGLEALMLLRQHLSPSSLEDLHELLRIYPGAVVEFSAYEMSVGDCPGRNAVIWEVRHY